MNEYNCVFITLRLFNLQWGILIKVFTLTLVVSVDHSISVDNRNATLPKLKYIILKVTLIKYICFLVERSELRMH